MPEEDYEQIFKKYFEIPIEQRTPQEVVTIFAYSLNTVRSNFDDNDLFEGVNLHLLSAIRLPASNSLHEYLEEVSDELLGWEDLEPVYKDEGMAHEAKRHWCDYIEKVISKIKVSE
jgi:hypothetical protein